MASIVPLQAALATNESPSTDGLVVFAKPRNAVGGDDGAIIMGAVDGLYIFDVTLYTDAGAPYLVTDYSVDINSLYGDDQGYAPILNVWNDRWTGVTATNQFTVRVPVLDLMWADMPFGGVGFTVIAHRDGNGDSLKPTTGPMPGGSYNILANEAVKAGRFSDADQLDEVPTPIGLVSSQRDGLVQPGNPLLNAGFEVGFFDPRGLEEQPRLYAPSFQNFATSTFPWYAVLNNPDGDESPASKHYFTGGSSQGGSHLAVRYSQDDDGKSLGIGQLILPGYVATEDLALTFDVQVYDFASKMAKAGLAVNMHGSDENGVDHADSGRIEIPVDGTWHRVTVKMDLHNVWANRYDLTGMDLTSVYFDFSHGTNNGYNGQTTTGAQPIFKFDNVVVEGVTYTGGASPRNDLNDGYSTFIEPLASVLSDGQDVVVDLVNLADGSAAYVFDLSAMSYLGGQAKTVDMSAQNAVFQLLDEDFPLSGGSHGADGVTYSTTNFYQFTAPDGTVSERVLVVVPLEDLVGFQVPWMFVDVDTSPSYTDTFGFAANPASGYYSPARNALKPFTIADHLDYMATPVFLSGLATVNAVSPTTIALTCPGAAQGESCSADPTPELEVVVKTASPVIETLTVSIVSVANSSKVLGTQTITTPGGVVSFQLTQDQVDDLRDVEGDMTVIATVGGGLFAANAQSIGLDIDNVLPLAAFTLSPAGPLTKFSNIVLTDTSTDTDGVIETRFWTVTFISDPTPDADDTGATGWSRTGTGPTLGFSVPDDGIYRAHLLVIDNKEGSAEFEVDFTVLNVAPTGAINGPATSALGSKVFTGFANDDGLLESVEWTAVDENSVVVASVTYPASTPNLEATSFTVPFATGGTYTVTLVITDDDLATTTVTKTVFVDAVKPITALTVPAAPGTGWFTSDVTIGVARSDVGTGVAQTTVIVSGASVSTVGSANYTRIITTDGTHAISAFSTDLVGNVGDSVTAVVKVDKTAPTVSLNSLGLLPGLFGVAVVGDTIALEATAVDTASGVSSVEFWVDGARVHTDSDGTDGYTFDLDTSGMTGDFHEITALAYDVAGHVAVSASENLLLVG